MDIEFEISIGHLDGNVYVRFFKAIFVKYLAHGSLICYFRVLKTIGKQCCKINSVVWLVI